MAVHLAIQKVKDREYVSFRETYWDAKRRIHSSRTVKNFGRRDILEKSDPDIIAKLRIEAANYKTSRVLDEIKTSQIIAKSAMRQDNAVFNIGHCVYRQIWRKLKLGRKLREMDSKTRFDFSGAIFFLTAARSLMPDSKLSEWTKRSRYFFKNLSLNHIYRSLDLLVKNRDEIIRYLNYQIGKQYKRVISAVFYDVTTYYFESQKVDNLRKFGYSKDNKINEVQVVMGLLIDDNGIPIDYELYPGNTSEFSTMVPMLQKFKKEYGVSRVVVVADRGLNSGNNLKAIKDLGMDYVVAYRLRSASKDIKKLLDHSTWQTLGEIRYLTTQETRHFKKDITTSNLLITYSTKRAAKDRMDRERLISKANLLAAKPALFKSELHRGGKNYLKIDNLTVQLDKQKISCSEAFDGYYGIAYSNDSMTPKEVLDSYHHLWKIEESFRISKTILETRPCFHWKESRIRGHFLLCFIALVQHRLLELELLNHGIKLTTDQIIDALREASVQQIKLTDGIIYGKSHTRGNFETIAKAVNLGELDSVVNTNQLKAALRIKTSLN